jgi:hypothetical protein
MSLDTSRPSPAPVARPAASRPVRRALGLVATLLIAVVTWAVGSFAGADYWITDSMGSVRIDLVVVAQVTLVVGLAGWASLALLERFTNRGTAIWTVLAVVVLIASYVPVLLVEATTSTRVALLAVHTAVGVLIAAFRR